MGGTVPSAGVHARAVSRRCRRSPVSLGIVACLKAGACDVALLGNTPARAAEVDFSPPYLQGDFTYLVPAGSSVRRIADADQPGVRIAVVHNHAMDFALRGKLTQAEPVYAETPDAAFELLQTGHLTVLAGIRPGLLTYSGQSPGSPGA
jgi:polar amino acid transport system substrate-binding protein